MNKLDTTEFIKRSIIKHGDAYNYEKVIYVNNSSKVTIICKIHGEFSQQPRAHLIGQGCPICGTNNMVLKTKRTNICFISKSKLIHNNKYDYSLTEYTLSKKNVKIICPVHGIFLQTPDSHLQGSGCSKCGYENHLSWTKTDWINRANGIATLYIIRIYDGEEEFIKIGRTYTTITQRFQGNKIPYEFEIIKEIKGSPGFVWDKEIELHKKFKNSRYFPKKKFSGSTECFNIDII